MTSPNTDQMWVRPFEIKTLGLRGWTKSVTKTVGKDTWIKVIRPARFVKEPKRKATSNPE